MFFLSEKFKHLDILKVIAFFPRIIIASVNNVFFKSCELTIEMLVRPLELSFYVIIRKNV